MTATTVRDEQIWNKMFEARHISRCLSTSALAILTAYRLEIERKRKTADPREDWIACPECGGDCYFIGGTADPERITCGRCGGRGEVPRAAFTDKEHGNG